MCKMAYGDPPPQQRQLQEDNDLPRKTKEQLAREQQQEDIWNAVNMNASLRDQPQQMQRESSLVVKSVVFDKPLLRFDETMDPAEAFKALAEQARTIPAISQERAAAWVRDNEDWVDRSHSQGRSRIIQSKLQKAQWELSVQIAVSGSEEQKGLSGVQGLITSSTLNKSEVKVPEQKQEPGFWPFGKKK